MKRILVSMGLGMVAVVGFATGMTTHAYAVSLSSLTHTTVPVVGDGGQELLFRTFTPMLFIGIAALALLAMWVAGCLTVTWPRRSNRDGVASVSVELTGRPSVGATSPRQSVRV